MSGILRLESLTKGNTLKQGDKTPLKYRLFDADGEKLNIAGKSAKVRLVYPDFLTIGYEKNGLTVAQDDTVTFTIDSVIPARIYHVEIIVDDKFIFPSRADESKFTVDKSSLGTEANIIEIVGVDTVVRKAVDLINEDPSLIIDEDKLVGDIISNTGIGSINDYYQAFDDLKPRAELSISKSAEALTKSQNALNVANGIDAKATNALGLSESADALSKSVQEQFNQIVINGDSSVEAAQARVDASGQTNPTLKARLDKEHNEVTAQLAQIENKQDWYEVFKKIRVKNDDRIIFKKINDNSFYIYIHHYANNYQCWIFSRDTVGLDNNITSHANGDAWQVKQVDNVKLGRQDFIDINDPNFVTSGSWTTYGNVITSANTGAYIEMPITGSDISLRGTFRNNGGIANVTIDGVDYGTFDFYDISSGGTNIVKPLATRLEDKEHIVRLTVSGTRNELSTGNTIRFESLIGTRNSIDFSDVTNLDEVYTPMLSGRKYRYGQSAIEIAINSTYNGNQVWSGTYHKYLYPTVANNQKIYIDGVEKSLDDFVTGAFYSATDVMFVQDLKLQNVVDIADVMLIQHFTSEGYHVKWNLDWLQAVTINTSYSAMFGTSVDRLIFGDSQQVWEATFDSAEKGDYDTYNMIGWQSQDNYIVSFKALNSAAMKYTNTPKKMYWRDRSTDAKVYVHRFKGDVVVGEKWTSEFIVSIAKCNNVNLVMS